MVGSSFAPELHLESLALTGISVLGEFSVFQTCEYSSCLAHPERLQLSRLKSAILSCYLSVCL